MSALQFSMQPVYLKTTKFVWETNFFHCFLCLLWQHVTYVKAHKGSQVTCQILENAAWRSSCYAESRGMSVQRSRRWVRKVSWTKLEVSTSCWLLVHHFWPYFCSLDNKLGTHAENIFSTCTTVSPLVFELNKASRLAAHANEWLFLFQRESDA